MRNYRFTYRNSDRKTFEEVIPAYDLNEAMTQFAVKYRWDEFDITEIIPFKYIEEQKPVVEQKKEVHVKPLPRFKL